MNKCIIINKDDSKNNFLIKSKLLKGSYICTNDEDYESDYYYENLGDCINYKCDLWHIYALRSKNIKYIYCFDIPTGSNEELIFIGISNIIINNSQYLKNISKYIYKLTTKNSKLKLNISNKKININELNHSIIKINKSRGKIIYHYQKELNEEILLYMEYMSRNIAKYCKKNNMVCGNDKLIINIYYNSNNEILYFNFGLPKHDLHNISLDDLLHKIEYSNFI